MNRITEYSGGVAVIPHDQIKEAAAKLAAYEDADLEPKEQMEKLIAEMMVLVCDNLCHHPKEAGDQESLEEICAECQMGKFVCDILNNHNKVNDFDKVQSSGLLKRMADFFPCEECHYCKVEKNGVRWCRMSSGLDGDLEPGSGCTRGKRLN